MHADSARAEWYRKRDIRLHVCSGREHSAFAIRFATEAGASVRASRATGMVEEIDFVQDMRKSRCLGGLRFS